MSFQLFVVPAGTPLPLEPPPPTILPSTLSFIEVKVDSIVFSDKPVPGIVLLGKVVFDPLQTLGTDLVGAVNVTTFGYEEGTPAKFSIWSGTIPGSLLTYVPLALGTLRIVKPLPPPPPPANQTPVAIITPDNQRVINPWIILDGTKSYDPDGDPITFSWRSVGQPAAVILAPTSPSPQVQFLGRGEYTFELTVTDDKGLSGKATSTVLYLGR
jgi:hypothetical protein